MWGLLLDRLIFQPTRGIDLRPEELGVDAQQVFLRSEDGVRLHAFYLTAPGGADRAFLLLHGNAGNASQRLPEASALARLGANVLLPDYRGYGLSQGRPSEAGVYADARAALAHLTGRGIPERRVVVFGHSLGGAIAVDLAQDRRLAGLVLEGTFPSVAAVAGRLAGAPAAWLVRGRFDSARKIGRVRCPVLVLHGERDEVIDPALGRRLFELAPEPKRFETIPRAGHNDAASVGGSAYLARLRRFLDEVAA